MLLISNYLCLSIIRSLKSEYRAEIKKKRLCWLGHIVGRDEDHITKMDRYSGKMRPQETRKNCDKGSKKIVQMRM